MQIFVDTRAWPSGSVEEVILLHLTHDKARRLGSLLSLEDNADDSALREIQWSTVAETLAGTPIHQTDAKTSWSCYVASVPVEADEVRCATHHSIEQTLASHNEHFKEVKTHRTVSF